MVHWRVDLWTWQNRNANVVINAYADRGVGDPDPNAAVGSDDC
jgi:hypothetical protein